ncbi:putative membrane protein [Polaromonas sp. CF318]|uniref:RDD family protein n=1 Tax=Polaromonas sp. CF318 TaxID=1144318 RepID=UPI000270F2B2|nr:RDD family protein [Polaromonas sp. CF318]EJL76796.1 putative membrane protein [Polaromonas sp. CF318]
MDQPMHDARYAPPQATVADVADANEGPQLAGRVERLGAVILDTVFQSLVLWLVSVLTPYNPWAAQGTGAWSFNPLSMAIGALIFVLLNGYLLATRGQTLGKVLLKLRIVRPSGEAVSPTRLALRYGAGFVAGLVMAVVWVYSLIDCLMIFRKSRRCLHDEIADTIVVKA